LSTIGSFNSEVPGGKKRSQERNWDAQKENIASLRVNKKTEKFG